MIEKENSWKILQERIIEEKLFKLVPSEYIGLSYVYNI